MRPPGVQTYSVKNIKDEQPHRDTLKYRLTNNDQQCFACALAVSCSPLGQKVVHQQFLIKMTNAAFKDLFPSVARKCKMLDDGRGKVPVSRYRQGATENPSTKNASINFSRCAMANSFFVDKLSLLMQKLLAYLHQIGLHSLIF